MNRQPSVGCLNSIKSEEQVRSAEEKLEKRTNNGSMTGGESAIISAASSFVDASQFSHVAVIHAKPKTKLT